MRYDTQLTKGGRAFPRQETRSFRLRRLPDKLDSAMHDIHALMDVVIAAATKNVRPRTMEYEPSGNPHAIITPYSTTEISASRYVNTYNYKYSYTGFLNGPKEKEK